MWETRVQSLGWEDPLEKGKANHSSILAWRIPWTKQSMGSQRVGHNWVTSLSLAAFKIQAWFTKLCLGVAFFVFILLRVLFIF